jgi:hypothetical protein
VRARGQQGALTSHGLRVALGRLEARTDRLLAERITHAPNRRFFQHLQTERPALFTCLRRPACWPASYSSGASVATRPRDRNEVAQSARTSAEQRDLLLDPKVAALDSASARHAPVLAASQP